MYEFPEFNVETHFLLKNFEGGFTVYISTKLWIETSLEISILLISDYEWVYDDEQVLVYELIICYLWKCLKLIKKDLFIIT
jgi:hypothetical protein